MTRTVDPLRRASSSASTRIGLDTHKYTHVALASNMVGEYSLSW